MGYRHYFYKVKKEDIQKIRDISLQDLKNKYADEDDYIDFKNVIPMILVHELGKLYWDDTFNQISSLGFELFDNKDVMEYFSDHDIYVVGKEGLLKTIEIYQNKIIRYLGACLVDTKDKITDKLITSDFKLREEIEEELLYWSRKRFLNLDENDLNLSNSRMYKHAIFDLVHFLKTIDWETETLILYGY